MTSSSSTLLFVDPTVSDYETLVQSVGPNTQVIILDANSGGVEQITETLAYYDNLQGVQILSHGVPGGLQLGSSILSTETLEQYRNTLQSWANALAPDADILLYGCNVAAGNSGADFINAIATLTGADVAASTNLTGSSALGGDWQLEARVGTIESSVVFQAEALETYQSVLAGNLLFKESFADEELTSGPWIYGALAGGGDDLNPFLTARDVRAEQSADGLLGVPAGTAADSDGSGALRLTGLVQGQSTFVIYNQALSSSSGLDVTFDFYSYGGSTSGGNDGADGISFFLIDGDAQPTTAGGAGGSLGYANRLDVAGAAGNGLVGGYLGIGFDEYGNFANAGDRFAVNNQPPQRNGGVGTGVPDAVTVRGPGNGSNGAGAGYEYITHQPLGAGLTIDNFTATKREDAVRTARIVINSQGRLRIFVDADGRDNPTLGLIKLIEIENIGNVLGEEVPETFKFGFGASTGALINIHELNNVTIRTVSSPPIAIDRAIKVFTTDPIALTGSRSLSGIDPDGQEIVAFIITKLPAQGQLIRGNGNAITSLPDGGLRLTPNQAAKLVYQPPTTGFSGDEFEYTVEDANGATDPTPARVALVLPPNQAPIARDLTAILPFGDTLAQVPPLLAEDTDPGDSIVYYTLTRLPNPAKGLLYLGDPTSTNARILQVGDRLTPSEIDDIFFQAEDGFSRATFSYTATDTKGAFSEPAATVTITQGEDEEGCEDGITATATPGVLLSGTGNSDTLTGTADGNTIIGRGCIDIISGLDGNDSLQGGQARDTIAGGLGSDTLIGGRGSDFLEGAGAGSDAAQDAGNLILGVDGNDTIFGAAGNDSLFGGFGDDSVEGSTGKDFIKGSRGADILNGGDGFDRIVGGRGGDVLSGGLDRDKLFGRAGNDILNGGAGDDRLDGGFDSDILNGAEGNDFIFGDKGNDTGRGGIGDDTLRGQRGDDRLEGGDGNDTIRGNRRNDDLFGDAGDDTLSGGLGNDFLDGGDGNDILIGRLDNDSLFGGAGEDVLRGQIGNDRLFGGSGNDTLRGNRGEDLVSGGDGNDLMFGSYGNDTLIGGAGADTLSGTSEADQYVYQGANAAALAAASSIDSIDLLTDFNAREGDRISLQIDTGALLPSGLFNAGSVAGTTLAEAVAATIADKNQVTVGAQALAVGEAAFFSFETNTYLLLNQGTASFEAASDLLISFTDIVLRRGDNQAGVLTVTNYFV